MMTALTLFALCATVVAADSRASRQPVDTLSFASHQNHTQHHARSITFVHAHATFITRPVESDDRPAEFRACAADDDDYQSSCLHDTTTIMLLHLQCLCAIGKALTECAIMCMAIVQAIKIFGKEV